MTVSKNVADGLDREAAEAAGVVVAAESGAVFADEGVPHYSLDQAGVGCSALLPRKLLANFERARDGGCHVVHSFLDTIYYLDIMWSVLLISLYTHILISLPRTLRGLV
ncbi:hypothetical protein RSOLAG1IB_12566 [Rhizoctonia solani AG-1 IB]|uniref:Uncharacterized protein n=1 Tax=Thanatephorus cucumeris (strain AG1-IB / isolate 7/3/14) TaxID=1108050 RepID=A0A0B7G1Q1_THACB|nr:hypothetical protein RSOLAG1IB_12566 [Rhizoctonia solani AG-1 IB]